jgi:RNA polymerase sigma factor (sigma-70 family)
MTSAAPTSPWTDEQLAARIARPRESAAHLRDAQDACRELYQRHARPLLAFLAGRVARADLEDAHHAVWLRVWEKLPTQFDGRHFRGWLFQIARNHLIDQARRQRPDLTAETDDWAAANTDRPDERLLEEERRLVLERCLKKMDEVLAALIRGRLGGEGYPELCRRLSLPAERAHRLFHQAKDQLQTCVDRSTA